MLLVNNKGNSDYTIFVGDINIDIAKDDSLSIEYSNVLLGQGFISAINDYTRCSNNSKTCIDHIFVKTNHDIELLLPIIVKTNLTDHYSLLLQILFELQENKNIKPNSNSITKINYNKLKHRFTNISWDRVLEIQDGKITKALIKRTKTAFFRNKIKQAQNNPKKLWQVVDELNSRKKHPGNRLDKIIANGNILEDSQGIANAMNSHYVSVGTNLAREIIQDGEYTPPRSRIISHSLFLYATDPIEVKGIILSLKMVNPDSTP
ncbi:hypothetical protein JTB14_036027 [Gonioctena quinquepunctata]|nr:hypothetical protein JTB14_036027 [Gonioctena quinquepunctata]